jgi:predicted metal-binding membrane protein
MTHHHGGDPLGFAASAALWFAMMAAMMAPTAWPWVRSFHRFGGSTLAFASGYLAAWLAYSVAAAAIQRTVHTPASLLPFVFAAAGLWQFAPVKRACLDHCRNPIGYFLARWRDGSAGGFRMGLDHGIYCVGCCWAIMATMIVVGVSSVWWMTALAAVAFVEQVAPYGDRLRIPLGVAFVAAAFV